MIADDLPILVYHKLGKVPWNLIVLSILPGWIIRSKEFVDGMGVRTIDVYLGEHWELYAVLTRCKRLDLLIRARFLPLELIAGKGQNL